MIWPVLITHYCSQLRRHECVVGMQIWEFNNWALLLLSLLGCFGVCSLSTVAMLEAFEADILCLGLLQHHMKDMTVRGTQHWIH